MKKVFYLLFVFTAFVNCQKSFAQSVAAGYYHSLFVCSSGIPKGAGSNWDGQLGIGSSSEENTPVAANGLSGIIAVAGGEYHTLALKNNGTVWAYGANWEGQLGDGTGNFTGSEIPIQVSGLTGVTAIAAGRYFSLALKSDGTIWAWGANWNGELGDGTGNYDNSDIPTQVSGLTGVTAIGAGDYHGLAVKSNGTAWAWGNNGDGQLGDGSYNYTDFPVQVTGLTGITAVAGGNEHSLALKSNGTVWSWGDNSNGQLGDGTNDPSTVPVQVLSITGVIKIAAGSYHSLAIKSDGTAWSWGGNWNGQLGDGTTNSSEEPGQITGLTNIVAIAGGESHSCAMKNDGTFRAWGYNNNGQLGNGTNDNSLVPVLMRDCCTGQPDIALSDTCVIDTTEIGGSSQYNLYIRNSACGTLNVTNITSNNAAFSVSLTAVSVSAYDSALVVVTYSPTILGNNLGTLTIFNNVNTDTSICLAGYCLQAPDITSSPVSFNVSLSCNGISTSTLTIGNTGLGTLDFDAEIEGSGIGADFYDGFESGNISSWTNEGGAYTNQVITADPAKGTYALKMTGGFNQWLNDGLSHSFSPSQPPYISFRIKSEGGNSGESHNVVIGNSADLNVNGPLGYFWVDNNNSTINLSTWSTNTLSYPLDFNTWHKIEFKNINYSSKKFDYYVDGNLIFANITFENSNISSLNIIHLFSFDSNTCYFDEILFGEDPTSWLSVNPTSGTIPTSGSSANINVNFNAANLATGVYYGNVGVYSNDPATPRTFVPCTLTVTGGPDIDLTVASCTNYSSIMVGATSLQNFQVDNVGCDTLHISNVTSSSGQFVVNSFPAVIPPFASRTITATFQPNLVGAHTATISVDNLDDNDTIFCVQGTAVAAPTVSVTPSSFNVTAACSQSVTSTLTVNNTGAANLNVSIYDNGCGLPPVFTDNFESGDYSQWTPGSCVSTYSVLSGGSPQGDKHLRIAGGCSSTIPGLGKTFSTPQTPSYTSFYVKASTNTRTQGYYLLGTGTTVIAWFFMKSDGFMGLSSTDAFVPYVANQWYHIEYRNINYSTHRLDFYVDGVLIYGNYPFRNNLNSVTTLQIFNFTPSSTAYYDDIIVGTCPGVSWMNVTPPTTGTITPTSSATYTVNFNSAGLAVGTYTNSIDVNTNDPLNPSIQIPCTFTVTGNPDISLPGACPAFSATMVGITDQKNFQVDNLGCDTLHISNATSSSGQFVVNSFPAVIPPFASRTITATFQPTAAASHTTTITVFNDDPVDPNATFCLQGIGLAAPTVSVTPSSFDLSVACSQSVTSTLTISNPGSGTLTYSLFMNGVGNLLTPVTATCSPTPGSKNNCCNMGIHNVTLNTINYNSSPSDGRYNDYSSTQQTTVFTGQAYPLSVQTGTTYPERVRVWIDWNNNGGFEGSELVLSNQNTLPTVLHTTVVIVPASAVKNLGLRMRVATDYTGSGVPGPCTNASYGQTEDYVVKVGWTTFAAGSGTVTPSGSENVSVNFYSTALAAGTYTSTISVNSNDPANPSIQVACTFTVTGSADIDIPVTGCPSFNTSMVGAADKDTFTISNIGCDTLYIANVNTSSGQFIINSYPAKIAPYNSGKLIIWFQPTAVGNYSTTITVSSNLPDEVFCLQGVAVPAPTFSVTPAAFNLTAACSQSVTGTLTINNPGAADLTYSFPTVPSPAPTCAGNTATTCCDYGIHNVQFNTINNSSANSLAGYQDFTSISTAVRHNNTYQLNVLTGYTNEYVNAWIDWNNNGVWEGAELVMNNNSGSLNHITNILVPSNALQNTSLRMRIASSYYSNPTSCGAVNYGQHEDYTIFVDKWLTITPPLSGTITPTNSVNIPVTFNSAGLTVGTYTASITVNSNDPLIPTTQIPCTFTVTGTAQGNYFLLDSVGTSLDLDSIMAYTESTDTIEVSNTGCDTLFIESLQFSSSAFDSVYAPDYILPGDTNGIIVRFAPSFSVAATTTVTGTVTVYTNDTDPVINLHGEVYPYPIQTHIANSYSITLGCNDTLVDTLMVFNNGGSELTFQLQKDENQQINILLVCGESNSSYRNDVRNKLINTGRFNQVITFNATSSTPSLAQLQLYDAVMVWGSSFSNTDLLGDTLADYIDAGGGVVTAMYTNGGNGAIGGRFASDNYWCMDPNGWYTSGGPETLGTVYIPNHPLMSNVLSFNGGDNSYRPNSINPSATRIADWSDGLPLVVTKDFSGKHRVDLGMYPPSGTVSSNNFWDASTDGATLMANALQYSAHGSADWMTLSPGSGTVAPPSPADTSFVSMEFVSTNLIIGTYNATILIHSNDPLNSTDTVSVTLNVVGAPAANYFLQDSLGNCLDLDSIMTYTETTDTIAIFNTGCDTLFVNSLEFSDVSFDSAYAADFILPGDTDIIVVRFAPSFSVAATTTVTGTVTVHTNDNSVDSVFCLHGEVFPQSIQTHAQSSYSITIGCNDTIVDTLMVFNTGGSDLTFQLKLAGAKKINALLLAAEGISYQTDVQAKLMSTGKFNLVNIFDASSGTPTLAQLKQYDAVMVWTDNNFSDPALIGDILADYMDGGGGVVTAMQTNGGIYPIGGRFSSDNYWCIDPSGSYTTGGPQTLGTVYIANHPVMENVNSFNGGSASWRPLAIVPGATRIADWSDGSPLVATRKINASNRVDLGMYPPSFTAISCCWWDPSTDGAFLMANALHYSAGAAWLTLSPTAGTIAPPSPLDTSFISLEFVSTNLIVGTYTTSIVINSNDPLNSSDTISVTMKVEGVAEANYFLIDSIGNCLDLDSIMETTTSTDTIGIFNSGCDTIFINSVLYSDPQFSTLYAATKIPPGDTNGIIVKFAPTTVGTGTATCTMTIDMGTLGNELICLQGKVFAKPVQCHSPNTYTVHFTVCEDTIPEILEICNTGLGNLNYELWSPYERSAQFDGSNDYIATGTNIEGEFIDETVTLELWFKANAAGVLVSENGQPGVNSGGWHDSHMEILSGGQVYVRVWGLGTLNLGTVGFGTWNHAVLRYNKSTLTLDGFLNGTEAATDVTGDRAAPWESGYDMYYNLGATESTHMGSGAYFNGNIDEFRIWNTARTTAEIQANKNKRLSGNETGLVAYWNFDDSTATDQSVNTNNGVLTAGTSITRNVEFIPASTGTVTPSGTYSVQVEFKKVGLAPGTHNFPVYLSSNDPDNGMDTINVTFDIDALPPSPTAGSNSPVCAGTDLSLTASIISGATYSWTGPDSYSSTLQNPVIPNASTAASGTYSVTASVSGCPQGAAGTTSVTVNPAPSTPAAGSPGTICSGLALTLTATTISGASYSWTGPNSFSSTLQNPGIAGATTAASGTYSVTATVPGCPPTAVGTTTVLVYQTPGAPTASSNSPVCAGNDLSLNASTILGVSYAWMGPNSFTNAAQNPVISSATVAATGTYSVSATQNGCTGPIGTTPVIINPAPSAPTAGSNSTVCSGLTLSLAAGSITSATYSWNGPNGFTSAIQNPTIAGVTTAASGTYSVTATVPGCPTSPSGTTAVTINQTPDAPVAGNNSPVCVGNDLSLTASPIAGVTYAWTGPASFTSTLQDPVIASVSTAGTGTYSVAATIGGCTGPKGATFVVVNPPPSAPVVTSNSAVCSGNTLTLFANTISGATYSWTGPASFTSSLEDPTLAGVATSNAGTYSVTATVGGCPTSPVGTGTVVVNQSPDAPSPVTSNSPVCSGQTLSLTATVSGATYSWTGPLSFTSTIQDPTIASVATTRAGTYSVIATVSGCPSPAGTVSVTIYQTPSAPSASSNSPVCAGLTLSLNGGTVPGATYAWTGPLSFTANSEDPSIAVVSSDNAGTYSVTVTVNGCPGVAGTTSVVVNDVPASPSAGSSTPVCSGQTLSLNATTVSGAVYSWSGPNGFTSAAQNPNIAAVTTLSSGTYSVSAVVGGCPPGTPGTTSVTINQTPDAPAAASNSPVCLGSTLSLTASTISGVTYSWTGPDSFTDATQNPAIGSIATTNAGTYSVTATVNGCTGPGGTTTVTTTIPPSAPTAGNNSTICSGQTLSLSASTVSGASYSWTGPNSFTSLSQNPTIPAATIASSGTYSVTATKAGCPPSAAATTMETINQTPSAPVASANSPICVGFTLSLTASSEGTTYSWTGPNSFTSTTQDPTITSVTTANAGTYSVSATTLGCAGPQGTATVVVNTIPLAPTAADQNACFGGTIPDLAASGSNILWYDDLGAPAGSGSPFATGQTAAGTYTYTATQTENGCTGSSTTVILTINTLPSTPVASSDAAICYGNPTPSFTATGSNLTWYNNVGGIVGSGSPFTPVQTAPGVYTYYVSQTNTITTCESLEDSVKLAINSIAPPVAPDVAVCFGNPVPPLVATGTSIQWYDVTQAPVFSGSPFNTGQTLIGTYTYYVTQTNTVTTCSSVKDTVLLFISTQPTLAPIVSDTAACFGSTIPNLVATNGTVINWYSDAGLTSKVYTGNPFVTGLTAVGSYTFFATDSTPGCGNGPYDPVTLTIHVLPSTLSVSDTANCFGSTTPNLITSGNNIQWYNASLVVVSVNDTFATGQTAVGTYTYYVTQTNIVTGCESVRDSVQLTINGLPSTPTALDTVVCSATTIPNLTSTGTNVQWYDTSNTFVFTGNSYTTGQTTTGVHTYFVTQKDAVTGCESSRDTSVLVIMLSPGVPVANNVAVCAGNPIPFLTSTGTDVKWYSDAALTNLVQTGNTYNTGQTSVGIYTYYVTDSLTGCRSILSDSVSLIINSLPSKPIAGNATVCYGAATTLTATGTNLQWYKDVTLINMVGTGNPFNTGLAAVGTYTYYVTNFAVGCGNSVSDTAVITINPTPLVTANTYSTVIVQGGSTTLTAYNSASYAWALPTGLNITTGQSVIASPSVTTSYTVTGTNQYGCSNSVAVLVLVNPLGVSSLTDPLQDVIIYPNPAMGSFTLEFNSTVETPIDIYMLNMLGDKVRVIQGDPSQGGGLMKHKYKIDIGTLTEGVYNVEIVTVQGTVNRRVVLFR